jgi:hypothetical protein
VTAVQKIEPQEVAVNEATAVIQMIERAVLNPAIDVDKMERLLAMQERVMDRNAKAAFDAAMADLQPELPSIGERGVISTDKGKTVQSRYALWEDIQAAVKPVLTKHGFALTFRVTRREGLVCVTGVLSHREGHREETTLELPVDSSGSKNGVQAIGSSTSYGQRYTAKLLLNLTSTGEDDDGKSAGDPPTITEEQVADIQALMEEVRADRARFLTFFKVESLAALPAAEYARAIASLQAKRRA